MTDKRKKIWICNDDQWDGSNPGPGYESVEEFYKMCENCWGETPDMRVGHDGNYYDRETGSCILRWEHREEQ
jgi:hypothetical protein